MSHLTEEQLIDYIEGGKSDSHLENCALCQNTFQEISQIFLATRSLLKSNIPEILPETDEAIFQMIAKVPLQRSRFDYPFLTSRRILLSAASLLFGAFGLFLISSEIRGDPSVAPTVLTKETSPEPFRTGDPPVAPIPTDPIPTDPLTKETSPEPFRTGDPPVAPIPTDPIPTDPLTKETSPEPFRTGDPPVAPTELQNDPKNETQKPTKTEENESDPENRAILICGDLNQNGKLDAGDPILLLRNLQKNQLITSELGDVNTDGKVDFLDVHTLARQMVES